MMYGWLFKLGIVAALLAGIAAWGWAGGAASKQKAWDFDKGQQAQAILKAETQARATEQALQQKVNDANTALQTERAKHARIAAGLKRDADLLRNDITSFAGGKPDDTAAACGERAATLGDVLDGVLSDYRACTESAEAHATDLRAVLGAWPR